MSSLGLTGQEMYVGEHLENSAAIIGERSSMVVMQIESNTKLLVDNRIIGTYTGLKVDSLTMVVTKRLHLPSRSVEWIPIKGMTNGDSIVHIKLQNCLLESFLVPSHRGTKGKAASKSLLESLGFSSRGMTLIILK